MSFCVLSLLSVLALFAMLRGAASSPVSRAGGSGQRVTDDGRFVKIQWSRSGVQGHTVSEPLVVFLGQTLQLECPEVRGSGAVYELLGQPNRTADLAEKCQVHALKLNRSQLTGQADCEYQNEIVIKEPNYLPGRIYHFADVKPPPDSPWCSFVMTIQVRRRGECPFADETECEPKSSTSLPVPSPTATMTPLNSPSIFVSVSSSVFVSKSISLPLPSPSLMTAAVGSAKPSILILSFLISVVVWLITH